MRRGSGSEERWRDDACRILGCRIAYFCVGGEGWKPVSDDIVTRLRTKYSGQLPIAIEAADEIERLRSVSAMLADEVERLRAEVSRLGSFLQPIGTVIDGQVVHG